MDQKLQEELLKWLKAGGEFVEREAPQLAQEIVQWDYYQAMAWLIVCIVGVLVLVPATIYGAIQMKMKKHSGDPGWFFLCLTGTTLGLLSAIGVFANSFELIKAKTAPRIVIMEQLKSMSK